MRIGPQWRGPNRDGKSPESGLLEEWPEGGPAIDWTAEGLGRGFSSVSVSNGRVFTMGDFGDEQFVIAINDDDGSILWKRSIGESWTDSGLYPGSRSTPTVDGDRIYAYGTEGTLLCLKADSGEVVWQRNMREDFGGFVMMGSAPKKCISSRPTTFRTITEGSSFWTDISTPAPGHFD